MADNKDPRDSGLDARMVLDILRSIEATDPEEFAKQLASGDGELVNSLVLAFPGLLNTMVRVFREAVERLEEMPPVESSRRIAESLSGIDGKEVGRAVNSLSRLLIRVYQEEPAPFTWQRIRIAGEIFEAVDFGKLRKALSGLVRARMEYRLERLSLVGEQPIAVINLVNVVPEYLNSLIETAYRAFSILALPPEAMSFALIKVLEEIDWERLAEAVNAAAALVNALNRGDLILGEGALRFEQAAGSISQRLERSIDWAELCAACRALASYRRVALTSLAGAALEGGRAAEEVAGAAAAAANEAVKTWAYILKAALELPSDELERIATAARDELELRELGGAISAAARLVRSLDDADPELLGSLVSSILSPVDYEEITRAGVALVAGLGRGLAVGEWEGGGGKALTEAANRMLAASNRISSQNPLALVEWIDGFAAGLDEREAGEAARNVSAQLVEAARRHPGVAGAVVKAISTALLTLVRDYLRRLTHRGGRGAGG